MKTLKDLKRQKTTTTAAVLAEMAAAAYAAAPKSREYLRAKARNEALLKNYWRSCDAANDAANEHSRAINNLCYISDGDDVARLARAAARAAKKMLTTRKRRNDARAKHEDAEEALTKIARAAARAVLIDDAAEKAARAECKRRNRHARQINRLIASQSANVAPASRRKKFAIIERLRNATARANQFYSGRQNIKILTALPNRRFYKYLIENFSQKKYLISRAAGNCHGGTTQFLQETGGKIPARGSRLARDLDFQKAVAKAAQLAIFHRRRTTDNGDRGE